MTYTFTNSYDSNPWTGIETNQRQWYEPQLVDIFRKRSVYGQLTTYVQNLANRQAKTMSITSLYDTHANFDPIGLRQMWMPSSYVDSRTVDITFNRYGGKMAYDRYSEIVSYWNANIGSNATGAIRRIVNDKLGQHMVDVQDLLSRNAYLGLPNKSFASGATDFSGLTDGDILTTRDLSEVHLGMSYRDVPYAQSPDGRMTQNVIGVISPGVYFDLQNQSDPKDWLIPQAYANPSILLRYEVGTYKNIRWIVTPRNTLWNTGKVTIQVPITTAINAGDGAPDPSSTKVDATYKVGQVAARHYIQLGSTDVDSVTTDMTKFAVNDIVTIHVDRTSNNGVTNGVDFYDGNAHNLRIVSIDAGNKRLTFDRPIMQDLDTDLGGGVYAYVTKGHHVHANIFIGGPDAIVNGVGRPVELAWPAPVDDFGMMQRYTWSSYQGYQVYNPHVADLVYTSGSVKVIGGMLQGG